MGVPNSQRLLGVPFAAIGRRSIVHRVWQGSLPKGLSLVTPPLLYWSAQTHPFSHYLTYAILKSTKFTERLNEALDLHKRS